MSGRGPRGALWLVAVVAPALAVGACSLLNDMSEYTGGDAGAGADTYVIDTFEPDTRDAAPETAIEAGDGGDGGDARDTSLPPDTADAADVFDAADTADTVDAADSKDSADASDTADGADASDASDGADAPPVCHPMINEVETGTSTTGTDEFIEIYNPCTSAIVMTGWKVVYRASTNIGAVTASDSTLFATLPTTTIAAGGYYWLGATGSLFDTPDASPAYVPDLKFAAGMAGTSGAVGLRDAFGTLVDSVYWGAAPSGGFHAFIETTPVSAPSTSARPGTSISRVPNGTDTNDNSKDFKSTAPPTPGAANL